MNRKNSHTWSKMINQVNILIIFGEIFIPRFLCMIKAKKLFDTIKRHPYHKYNWMLNNNQQNAFHRHDSKPNSDEVP